MRPLSTSGVYSTGRFWKDHWTRYNNAVGEKKVEVERSKQAIARIWPDQSPRGSPPYLPPWASIINPNYTNQLQHLSTKISSCCFIPNLKPVPNTFSAANPRINMLVTQKPTEKDNAIKYISSSKFESPLNKSSARFSRM